ncbi:LOW QUALITY PROTEIN: C9orf66 isoform 1 [Pongo abelii]|uniref:C9orf66 isoform 1 n=1 Tax=Pongo abelii TaxID=9601 RepID=A0A2J8XHE4_PONAB|nr:LOW QUALITY PROTEIN: C9orf66 isoform 1 [Pongo abelii]
MRHSVACPTRLPRRLSPSWDPATCKNLEGGAGEVVRGRDPRWLRTSRSTEILGEDLAGPSAGATARPAAPPPQPREPGAPGLRRAPPRTRMDLSGLGRCSDAPRQASAGLSGRDLRAAGGVLPVDLERERAALCARQSGHGPPAVRWLLGSWGAESGGPARRRVAAEHAKPSANLICQSELETSAFPPSKLKSPRGRAQAPSSDGQHRHPAWHAGSGGRGGRGPSAELASGYWGRRRALPGAADLRKGARADDRRPRSAGRKLHLPEAARLPGNVGKSGEPHKVGEVGNQPRDS